MILELSDIKHVDVKDKVSDDETYIDDDVVREMYYYPLVNSLGIDVEYLPEDSAINAKVKRYLVLCVYITVANDNVGSTMQQVVENVVLDIWTTNKVEWQKQVDQLESEISASLVYDPNNIPPESTDHPNVITWSRS